MQPPSEGIPSTVALLSDELLLAGVLIRLAWWRYAALAERRTCDNLHVAARSCISPVATRCPLSSQAAVVVQVQRSPVIILVIVSKSLLSLRLVQGYLCSTSAQLNNHKQSFRSLRLVQDDVVQDELAQAARIPARAPQLCLPALDGIEGILAEHRWKHLVQIRQFLP